MALGFTTTIGLDADPLKRDAERALADLERITTRGASRAAAELKRFEASYGRIVKTAGEKSARTHRMLMTGWAQRQARIEAIEQRRTERLGRMAAGAKRLGAALGVVSAGTVGVAMGIRRASNEYRQFSEAADSALRTAQTRADGLTRTFGRLATSLELNFDSFYGGVIDRLGGDSGGTGRTFGGFDGSNTERVVSSMVPLFEVIQGLRDVSRALQADEVQTARIRRQNAETDELRTLRETDTRLTPRQREEIEAQRAFNAERRRVGRLGVSPGATVELIGRAEQVRDRAMQDAAERERLTIWRIRATSRLDRLDAAGRGEGREAGKLRIAIDQLADRIASIGLRGPAATLADFARRERATVDRARLERELADRQRRAAEEAQDRRDAARARVDRLGQGNLSRRLQLAESPAERAAIRRRIDVAELEREAAEARAAIERDITDERERAGLIAALESNVSERRRLIEAGLAASLSGPGSIRAERQPGISPLLGGLGGDSGLRRATFGAVPQGASPEVRELTTIREGVGRIADAIDRGVAATLG